jgi:alkanesulfonate monooxygenase SsuD/methylene tetrahydromethanopterin reductase-like flavin-dependent oxidoreductase (luciferase family)
MTASRGFGVAGSLDHRIVAGIAAEVERTGFASFWANDTPGGEGLAALAAAARVTSRIDLGVGVIPVDRVGAEEIAARLAELGLPLERTIVGLGSGGKKGGALQRVETAVTELRRMTPARVYVGALGPRMCQLGGQTADGLLLNWLTPDGASAATGVVRDASLSTGRHIPVIAAYVRVALPAAEVRLQLEADRYTSYPQYAAHFDRLGVPALATTVHGTERDIQEGLSRFDGRVDQVIVRAIVPQDTRDAYLELVKASAPSAHDLIRAR